MRTPTGNSGGSTGRKEPVEFKVLDPRCDHQVFKHLETKKPLKFWRFWRNLTVLERFLAPSHFKLTWSHQGPRNSNSTGSSQPLDPNMQCGGVLIVNWKIKWTFLLQWGIFLVKNELCVNSSNYLLLWLFGGAFFLKHPVVHLNYYRENNAEHCGLEYPSCKHN